MRETILIDAFEEIKKIPKPINENAIYDFAVTIANKALTDYASAPKEGLTKEEILAKHIEGEENAFQGIVFRSDATIYAAMEEYAAQFQSPSSVPESGQNCYKNGLELAKKFHELYEKNAPNYGYETRKETREFNEDTPNGKLMIAVCEQILASLPAPESGGEEHDLGTYENFMKFTTPTVKPESGGEEKDDKKLKQELENDSELTDIMKGINDFVPSVQSSDVKPVASHSSTSSNSIEQLTDDEIKAAKDWWKTLSIHIRTCVRWLEGDHIDGSMTDDKYVKVYRKRDSNNFPDEYGVWEVKKTNSSLSKEEGKEHSMTFEIEVSKKNTEIERLKGLCIKVYREFVGSPEAQDQFAKENGLKGE